MSCQEHNGRSPMASRRVRRHAMGVSNMHVLDDGVSSISRSTVSLIRADRLVKVPQHLRPLDPAARETRVEDRPLVTRVYDKLFKTHQERYVRKVLLSLAGEGSGGMLTRDQLRAALDQLHVGLEREERERIIARVAPLEDSKVHFLDFVRAFEIPAPLGGAEVAVARGLSVPGPPVVRPGGGGNCGAGDGGRSYWNWQRHGRQRVPGLLDQAREDSSEQAHNDAMLTALVVAKLGNCRGKLRAMFRQMDADRNSFIDREEFARGLAQLGVEVDRRQVDRLFELCDADHNGVIDYTEFVQRFEEPGLRNNNSGGSSSAGNGGTTTGPTANTTATAVPLAQSLGLSPDELQGALRQPLVLELARNLYGKGSTALAPFKQLDVPKSGRLDLGGMTEACRALVPGITERQVAAVMAAVDPSSPAHVDYRSFIARVEAALAHPRMAHSAPPGGPKGATTSTTIANGNSANGRGKADGSSSGGGGGGGGGGGDRSALGALARFGEPLTVPVPLPTPQTRALSAVSLYRRAETEPTSPTSATASSRPPPPPLPLPSKATGDKDSLYQLHATAIAPLMVSLNRAAAAAGDPDLPYMSRSMDAVSEGGRSSKAPSHATGLYIRFWSKRYGDTSSVTCPTPGTSLSSLPDGPYVRKSNNSEFLHYQKEDKAKEVRRREQQVQRYATRSEIDSRYSVQDDASGANDGRLAVAKAARQRYEERCEMYDRVRQMQDKGNQTLYGRLAVFGEHKSDVANMPVWADQTKTYW